MDLTKNASLDSWLEHMDSQSWRTGDMKLDRLETMMARMSIARPAPRIITVAGTNGKGSTCYTCESLLLAHGLTVGTAISPHVDRFNERIRINGCEASDESIVAAFEVIESLREDVTLSYFEYSVLASFWMFVQAEVDVAVLEIGLGGRLDGFNVVDADTAVITSIGLDHQALLGDDVETIGAEKAGILRPQQRVVLGRDMPDSVLDKCALFALDPIQISKDVAVQNNESTCSVSCEEFQLLELPTSGVASHNLALALVAVADLVELDEEKVQRTLGELTIRGRMEMRRWRDRTLIVDVAHNPHGVRFLLEELAIRKIVPTVICCAMLHDKEHRAVFETVSEQFSGRWLFIDSLGERGMTASALNEAMGEVGVCCSSADIETFLDSETSSADVILGFGSFSLVEQLLIGVSERA